MDYKLSSEQLNVIKLAKSNNVICDSVAGSGKTTTILGIAMEYTNSKICMLTYNARLKFETRERVDKLNLNNIEVNSYHSFCCRHYYSNISTDKKIQILLEDDTKPNYPLNYNILIIDEAQDMTQLYYNLICKIVYDNERPLRIIIIGDIHQSIYSFNGADERYLLFANTLMQFNKCPWVNTNLSISYRTTKPIADFINKCILKENRFVSIKDSEYKPRYLICNSYIYPHSYNKDDTIDKTVLNEVLYYLKLGYKYDDIFILSPSIKEKSPVRNLIDELKKINTKIPIFISKPNNNNNKITEDDIKDKITFLTYHQSKGLERKVCIVYGVDSSYFEIFNNEIIDSVCPNEMYVALTRSTERLSIVHQNTKNYIQFLNTEELENYVDVINVEHKKTFINSNKRELNSYELTDYTQVLILNNVLKNILIEVIKEKNNCCLLEKINIDNDVRNYAILNYYIYSKYQLNIPLMETKELIPKSKISNEYKKLYEAGIIETIEAMNKLTNFTFPQFLRLCHIYYCIKNNEIHKLDNAEYKDLNLNKVFDNLDKIYNFKEYKEFNKRNANKYNKDNSIIQPSININVNHLNIIQDIIMNFDIRNILNNKMPNDLSNENKLNNRLIKIFKNSLSLLKVNINCHIDIFNNNILTIINMKDDIDENDIINAGLCSLIMYLLYKIQVKSQIYNPLRNELIKVSINPKIFIGSYHLLLLNRFIGFKQLTTDIFIEDNIKIFNSYFSL